MIRFLLSLVLLFTSFSAFAVTPVEDSLALTGLKYIAPDVSDSSAYLSVTVNDRINTGNALSGLSSRIDLSDYVGIEEESSSSYRTTAFNIFNVVIATNYTNFTINTSVTPFVARSRYVIPVTYSIGDFATSWKTVTVLRYVSNNRWSHNNTTASLMYSGWVKENNRYYRYVYTPELNITPASKSIYAQELSGNYNFSLNHTITGSRYRTKDNSDPGNNSTSTSGQTVTVSFSGDVLQYDYKVWVSSSAQALSSSETQDALTTTIPFYMQLNASDLEEIIPELEYVSTVKININVE